MKRNIFVTLPIVCAALLIAGTLTACVQTKWSAPTNSAELLQQFPVKFLADASGLPIARAEMSTARTVIACHYFLAGAKTSTLGLVYETYVPYQRNRSNYEKLGRTIKQDQRIKGDNYLICSGSIVEGICLSTDGTRYLRLYASNEKTFPAETLIKIAAKIAARIK
jgi:hypothetical protein